MPDLGPSGQPQKSFVSTYGWLLAPGDHLQADYTSPTRVKQWLEASRIPEPAAEVDQQMAYGQWLAQLLQNQLGVELVSLYKNPPEQAQQWPITLRADVVAELAKYFKRYKVESDASQ